LPIAAARCAMGRSGAALTAVLSGKKVVPIFRVVPVQRCLASALAREK
jgi:hypothetical protein